MVQSTTLMNDGHACPRVCSLYTKSEKRPRHSEAVQDPDSSPSATPLQSAEIQTANNTEENTKP